MKVLFVLPGSGTFLGFKSFISVCAKESFMHVFLFISVTLVNKFILLPMKYWNQIMFEPFSFLCILYVTRNLEILIAKST